LTIENAEASGLVEALEKRGVTADARGRWVRLSPDYLTLDEALREAAVAVAAVVGNSL
jgi:hypothetical protein